MLFDAHNHALRVLKGVPERGIYDNMKAAVAKVGRGKKRLLNARFRATSITDGRKTFLKPVRSDGLPRLC